MAGNKFYWSLLLVSSLFFSFALASQSDVECWTKITQAACNANNSDGCNWKTVDNYYGGSSSYCTRMTCYDGDRTNQTYCQSPAAGGNVTLKSFNLSCTWTASGSLCDPTGGDYFGNGCNDFDSNQQGCYNTYFCTWNASNSKCLEPSGGFSNQSGSSNNPSCSCVVNQQLCSGIIGCSFGGTGCTGNTGGIKCTDLNKTTCPDFTMLSTCCSWNGTNCTTSYDKKCYENVPDFPAGASFCQDYNAFKNKGLCENLTQSPWYMPCKWNNVTNECHYNNGAFGGFSNFNEIGTQTGCEAIGGTWKTMQYTSDSTTKTDSWCEFKYGYEGGSATANCDSGCWGCESIVSTAKGNTTAQAQSICENSALGYCEFRSDSNAFNGLGWCYPKPTYIDGGGKHCDSECGACQFLNAPQAQCQNSSLNCTWVGDVNAPNQEGYCYGKNEKRCGNDCFSCFDSSKCSTDGEGGSGVCVWDDNIKVCKPAGFTGEICFDATDNDNDGKIDCSDSDCTTDKFCGGDDLDEKFGMCPVYSTNSTCENNGCVWLKDAHEEELSEVQNPGHCDFPGAQCWENDGDQPSCQNTTGCTFVTTSSSFCIENGSMFHTCFEQKGAANCSGQTGCGLRNDPYSGQNYCEPLPFTQCFGNTTRFQSQANCERNETFDGKSIQLCKWAATTLDSDGGWCEPLCFALTGGDCNNLRTGGLCISVGGICEPTSFGGSCVGADGNKTKCTGGLNASCSWYDERSSKAFNNSVGPDWVAGWCDPKGDSFFVEFMGDQPMIILGTDLNESNVPEQEDIVEVGIREEIEQLVIGVGLGDKFTTSAACNGSITYNGGGKGSGRNNHTVQFYADVDGNTTKGCSPRDNSSMDGFEFLFKYQDRWDNSKVEVKAAYRCINETWGAVPVPVSLSQQKACDLVGGPVLGIDKVELAKLKGLYNKSKDLRLYVAISNSTSNDSLADDSIGPLFYSQGTYDSEFEDCTDTGADRDGDGIKASNDPDCSNYFKFGYVPNEVGFQCGDSQDNDGDGTTDCADAGCKSDSFFCGGSLAPDANDKTAPKINWLQVDTFHDSATIMYDTNEPANGSFTFYNNDSNCKAVNKTIKDVGLLDEYVPDYKVWHDAQLDAFGFNSQAFERPLKNATTYFYKTTICDVSNNCAISGCMNFTTKNNLVGCKTCSSTLAPVFTAQSGLLASAALGNLTVKIVSQAGNEYTPGTNAGAGVQLNHTEAKNFNLIVENPTDGNNTNWRITFINASVSGKISTSIQNFTGGTDVVHNTTTNGSYVGLGTAKCQEIVNIFRPKRIEIGVPGNVTTELWHCNAGLSNCTDVTANATHPANGSKGVGGLHNVTLNMTLWVVPAEWGC